jgi:hypothetical protein
MPEVVAKSDPPHVAVKCNWPWRPRANGDMIARRGPGVVARFASMGASHDRSHESFVPVSHLEAVASAAPLAVDQFIRGESLDDLLRGGEDNDTIHGGGNDTPMVIPATTICSAAPAQTAPKCMCCAGAIANWLVASMDDECP